MPVQQPLITASEDAIDEFRMYERTPEGEYNAETSHDLSKIIVGTFQAQIDYLYDEVKKDYDRLKTAAYKANKSLKEKLSRETESLVAAKAENAASSAAADAELTALKLKVSTLSDELAALTAKADAELNAERAKSAVELEKERASSEAALQTERETNAAKLVEAQINADTSLSAENQKYAALEALNHDSSREIESKRAELAAASTRHEELTMQMSQQQLDHVSQISAKEDECTQRLAAQEMSTGIQTNKQLEEAINKLTADNAAILEAREADLTERNKTALAAKIKQLNAECEAKLKGQGEKQGKIKQVQAQLDACLERERERTKSDKATQERSANDARAKAQLFTKKLSLVERQESDAGVDDVPPVAAGNIGVVATGADDDFDLEGLVDVKGADGMSLGGKKSKKHKQKQKRKKTKKLKFK